MLVTWVPVDSMASYWRDLSCIYDTSLLNTNSCGESFDYCRKDEFVQMQGVDNNGT